MSDNRQPILIARSGTISKRDETFQVGDIITIDNADRPDWARGRWRVVEVSPLSVKLEPVP